MFDNREKRMIKMAAARQLAADKERAAIEREKEDLLKREALAEKSRRDFYESPAGQTLASAGCYIIALALMCGVGFVLASLIQLWAFWTIAVLLVGAAVYFRKKLEFRAPFVVFAVLVFISSCSGSTNVQIAHEQEAAKVAGESATETARLRIFKANHERRLAYNNAHPAEVAKRKADAKEKARLWNVEALRNQQVADAATARYLARINRYMAIVIDHSTYTKAVLSSPVNIDWYVDDVPGITGDIESQTLAYHYRKSFIQMVKRENSDLTITHERMYDAHTGELLAGSSDTDVDYGI